jgi:hypothetical protein
LADFSAVGPDDGAGADVERGGLQLGKKFCGKNNGMAAAAFEERQGDGRIRRVESGDEIGHKIGADQWMIHQAEKHAVEALRQAIEGCLNRGELALFPVRVDDHFIGGQMDGIGDWFSVDAEHDAADADFRMAGDVQQMLEERAALVGKKGLWGAHALRGSAGEDDSGKHEALRELLGFDWVRGSYFNFFVSSGFHIAAHGHKFRDDADGDFFG